MLAKGNGKEGEGEDWVEISENSTPPTPPDNDNMSDADKQPQTPTGTVVTPSTSERGDASALNGRHAQGGPDSVANDAISSTLPQKNEAAVGLGFIKNETPKDSQTKSADPSVVPTTKTERKATGKLIKARPRRKKEAASDDSEFDAPKKNKKSRSPISSRSKARQAKTMKKKTKKQVMSSSEDSSSSSEDSSSDSSSSSSEDDKKKKKKKKRRANKRKRKAKKSATVTTLAKTKKEESSDSADADSDSDDEASESEDSSATQAAVATTVQPAVLSSDTNVLHTLAQLASLHLPASSATAAAVVPATTTTTATEERTREKAAKGSVPEFIRLDNLWSKKQYRYVTQPSTEDKDVGKYEGYVFNVIRHFDWQNRYSHSSLKIMSKHLKLALLKVMGKVHGISLEETTPSINPNMVFLHLDELKAYSQKLKVKAKKLKKGKRKERKKAKEIKTSREHIKILTKYLDKDYEETIKSLTPLLKSGKITFDLAWALFKSNDICYSATYGHEEQPRATKISMCYKDRSIQLGDYYRVECQFLDYNGEKFGMAEATFEIKEFKGVRKITSLPIYPLRFHRDPETLKTQLIERGKKFVAIEGMQYKTHTGMAYFKKDNKVIKVNVNGRIMLDPATFRRVRPNYQFSSIKLEDPDIIGPSSGCGHDDGSDGGDSDGGCDSCDEDDEDDTEDDAKEHSDPLRETKKQQKKKAKDRKKHFKTKVFEDSDDPSKIYTAEIYLPSEDEEDIIKAPPAKTTEDGKPVFTDEEYLIASPVALGFSFGEKLWLEFSVSGVSEIEWNEGAFESLIIPDEQKSVVRAMVESHGFAEGGNIDDVIRGKGKGLVAVLHGPPGTGKTLTAEGIAELLKKPLYSVSVGELGTTPPTLERSLTSILDIAHTWSALLLLDEADVFLEERTNFDIHRNALVSIFLRMLEYFQGILFLTTNRVAVFDPAFASRIHVGLRYGGLDLRARKKVWGIFLEKVGMLEVEGVEGGKGTANGGKGGVEGVGVEEIARLAGFELNGREIKNAVRTAQSVALVGKEPLGMKHLLQVLGVGNVFAKDLKGAGYEDAMRSYM